MTKSEEVEVRAAVGLVTAMFDAATKEVNRGGRSKHRGDALARRDAYQAILLKLKPLLSPVQEPLVG